MEVPMKNNMGRLDRTIRLTAGPILILAAIFAIKSMIWSVVLAAIGIIWLVTGLITHCPAYLPFGLSTRKAEEKQ
jgi:fatty acid desaturase